MQGREPSRERRLQQREVRRRKQRRQQLLLIFVAIVILVSGVAYGYSKVFTEGDGPPQTAAVKPHAQPDNTTVTATQSVKPKTTVTTVAESSTTASKASAPSKSQQVIPTTATSLTQALSSIGVKQDHIPFGPDRVLQTIDYDQRHYNYNSAELHPTIIVLHFTVSSTYSSAYNTFASNTPAPGPAGTAPETPGTCAHFVVDKDGTIYQLVPLNRVCRHAIGLNNQAIGIEMVEETSADNILNRPAQITAVTKLVKVLQQAYGIDDVNVIGHAMANDAPTFKDLEGWKNDHGDWTSTQVDLVRRKLAAIQ